MVGGTLRRSMPFAARSQRLMAEQGAEPAPRALIASQVHAEAHACRLLAIAEGAAQ